MNYILRFFKIWKSNGLRKAIKRTLWYIKIIIIKWSFFDIVNFANALRFRSVRIYTSCDIARVLPKSTIIHHPVGIVISRSAKIGENVQINQNVTIGRRKGNDPGIPEIKDNVTIHTGSAVLGDVTLHEGCTVGANSVVINDVEKGRTVVGAPATEV